MYPERMFFLPLMQLKDTLTRFAGIYPAGKHPSSRPEKEGLLFAKTEEVDDLGRLD